MFKPVLVKAAYINTMLGPMLALADEIALYWLEFVRPTREDQSLARLSQRGFKIISGTTPWLHSIENELSAYFKGKCIRFKTPHQTFGTPFQKKAWHALSQIPFGETRSYAQQALSIGKPTSYRAVGNANGANPLAIIIPCHRVIASDGSLGGYAGGLEVKRELLAHEKQLIK